MMDFILWVIQVLPDFLLAPPISAFTGFMFLFWTGTLVKRMIHL